jgi:hypothetical protein
MSLFKNLHLAGTYSSYAVPLSLKAEAVRAMLPDGLGLAPQGMTPAGEHPVILNFGFQQRVRFQWGSLNGPGFNYQEFSVGVPFVQLTDSGEGPFFTTPRLYLTNGLAVILGYLWGFAKRKARIKAGMHAQDRTYKVSVGNDTLIAGEFKPLGSPGAPSQFPYYQELQKAMGATIFADKTIWGPIVCSTYGLGRVQEVQPVEAEIHIPRAFLPGLPEGTIRVPGINQAKLGAFQTPFQTAWTMSMPTKCTSLKSRPTPIGPAELKRLEEETRRRVDQVKNDPEGRYRLREEFYQKYGFGEDGGADYGASELAFMRWEIERGVLNPPDDPRQPGSPWWRAVNEEFLYLSELAAAVYEAGLGSSDFRGVRHAHVPNGAAPGGAGPPKIRSNPTWTRASSASRCDSGWTISERPPPNPGIEPTTRASCRATWIRSMPQNARTAPSRFL